MENKNLTVYIYIPVLRAHDAASNDALQMVHWLKSAGYETALIARQIHTKNTLNTIKLSDTKQILSLKKNAPLVVHYCGYDRTLTHLLRVMDGPLLLRYHDITPPTLFRLIQWRSILFSIFGKLQVRRLIQNSRILKIITASEWTFKSVAKFSSFSNVVLPPLTIQHAPALFPSVTRIPKSILLVGRWSNHKGYRELSLVLDELRNLCQKEISNCRFSFTIVGVVQSAFQGFAKEVVDQLKAYQDIAEVNCYFGLSDAAVASLYQTHKLFLSLSKHEGFGVPLIEAQRYGLPVIALDSAAIPETLGQSGLLIAHRDSDSFKQIAKSIKQLLDDEQHYERLSSLGEKNTQRFTSEALKKIFFEQVLK